MFKHGWCHGKMDVSTFRHPESFYLYSSTIPLEIGIPVRQFEEFAILYSASQQQLRTVQVVTVPGANTSNESNLSLCAHLFKDTNLNTQTQTIESFTNYASCFHRWCLASYTCHCHSSYASERMRQWSSPLLVVTMTFTVIFTVYV